jgi:hypothetical protein
MFVCSNRSTLNQIRNTMHAKLCRAVKKISTNYFKTAQILRLIIQEVTLAQFWLTAITISPLAKIIKDCKPGKAADYATKRKEK